MLDFESDFSLYSGSCMVNAGVAAWEGDLLDPTGFIRRSFLPGFDHLAASIPTGRIESIAEVGKWR